MIIIICIVKRGSTWGQRERMILRVKEQDEMIRRQNPHLVCHAHALPRVLKERRTSFCFSHTAERKKRCTNCNSLSSLLHISQERLLCYDPGCGWVTLSPWPPPTRLPMSGGKKSTGRNYLLLLFARSDPGRTQASAAFLFSSCMCMMIIYILVKDLVSACMI
jgi:hypothetical protein